MTVVQPGGTLGILGGGQLGRMTAMVARRMGYRVITLEPDPNCPTGQVADEQVVAPYTDLEAARRLASRADVLTLEFENMPADVVEALERETVVRPGARALRLAQDRFLEKHFLEGIGIPVPRFARVEDEAELAEAVARIGLPAVLKTTTLGYDGKGQRVLQTHQDALPAFIALGRRVCILEQYIPFELELSVVVARDCFGKAVAYQPAENVHVGGVLDTSMVPARVTPDVTREAQRLALHLAGALEYVGVLALELFLTREYTLLANEFAPRPHNSGHWSIEACVTSQFEQQVRTAVGGRCGSTELLHPAATANLLGDLWQGSGPRWDRLLELPDVTLHLYGKSEPRAGRKMGHLTALGVTGEAARARVLHARALLTAPPLDPPSSQAPT